MKKPTITKRLSFTVAVSSLAAAGHLSSFALPTMEISDGNGASTSVSDVSGILGFGGVLGGWVITTSATLSGTPTTPLLDLIVQATYNGQPLSPGSTLTIDAFMDNLGPLNGTALNHVEGEEQGMTDTFNARLNNVSITTQTFNSTPFDGSVSSPAITGFPATLGIRAIVTANGSVSAGPASTSFHDHLEVGVSNQVPDGGTTAALLAAGALGGLWLQKQLLRS
jgi:hypothetical protein